MLPERVVRAAERAAGLGFRMSCEPDVGRLLTVLAGAVPRKARILEIGTGAGVGTAWLIEGLSGRDDVELLTIDGDEDLVDAVEDDRWPMWTRFMRGDALEVLPGLGRFQLIFADAPAGKWTGLDQTIGALQMGGLLVVDDMSSAEWVDVEHRDNTLRVRHELLTNDRLLTSELAWSSGVILAVRRHQP